MKTSIIISTYNRPDALQKTLWGYCCQIDDTFEIVIADDGSTHETERIIERFQRQSRLSIKHVWQQDQGFRKNRILNRAALAAEGDHLIFTDGDVIPRNDFVMAHRRRARRNTFVTGGSHINVPPEIHRRLERETIFAGRPFDVTWLMEQGMDAWRYRHRLTRSHTWARWLDLLTPRFGVFVGCNTSLWKSDFLAVGGFDETVPYGGCDKDLGIRLCNSGVRSRRCKFSLVGLHLAHRRPYLKREVYAEAKQHFRQLRRQRITITAHGIGNAVKS